MGFFRDASRAWRENTSLSNARAGNQIDDFRKTRRSRKRPSTLLDGMGTPFGRFDRAYDEDDDDDDS